MNYLVHYQENIFFAVFDNLSDEIILKSDSYLQYDFFNLISDSQNNISSHMPIEDIHTSQNEPL